MKYFGITIGPIFKTIKEANTPIGLWFGSTFFSYFSRTLCEKLGVQPDTTIFSPFFDSKQLKNDGLGLYHDRILFASEKLTSDSLNSLIAESKEQVASYFPSGSDWPYSDVEAKQFLHSYIKVDYVVLTEKNVEGKNIVFELNRYLDTLELMVNGQSPVATNLFTPLFVGKQGKRNRFLKESGLLKLVEQEEKHLTKNKNGLKSIEDLSTKYSGEILETLPYFSVVYSDGDKVGKLLKSMCLDTNGDLLEPNQQITRVNEFSKACLNYAASAAEKVHTYQGMTIYAGGDDLLFLAPVEKVLELCHDLNALFLEELAKIPNITEKELEEKQVSLSFGVGIFYYKYPLYEALDAASHLMYSAKESGGNRTCLRLIKHSGQTIEMNLFNGDMEIISKLLTTQKDKSNILQSIVFKLGELQPVFQHLFADVIDKKCEKDYLMIRFMNHFDNPEQRKFEPYIHDIVGQFYDLYLAPRISGAVSTKGEKTGELAVTTFQQFLRLLKFWQGGDV
ncbi:TPA: type III-B CRISPR-associated protein Cas10/Cmr2 [Streptococcus suis]|nr:type III-B CRISPR-associated protein Cas10/Cmr2 [Streptococcus suis]